MDRLCVVQGRCWPTVCLMLFLVGALIVNAVLPTTLLLVRAQNSTGVGSIAPSTNALLFGSSGNVRIDIPKPGIAVRIEVPREFLSGVISSENDTHFITSNIRNDYYYYNVVDESSHWTYAWRGNATDGACFKPNFSFYDPNAPYCVEIWNYLNFPGFKPADPTVDYCALPFQNYMFNCFTASTSVPKFVLFHGLASPGLAGLYNFTLSIANRTNTLGYPDFVHAWNTTLFAPASMAYNAGFIAGKVCDGGTTPQMCNPGPIRGKGVVYAISQATGGIVARAYLNQSLCQSSGVNCGLFNLTGLAPGNYQIEGSAGVDQGQAYSLTPCCSGGPPFATATIVVPMNGNPGFTSLPLRRAPIVCGSVTYEDQSGTPVNSLAGNSHLLVAGLGFGNPKFSLNVTVEGSDPTGHVFRFEGVSTNTNTDLFNLTTGTGVMYVGTDPYGTEFAGLPAPEDSGSSGYTITVKVWVSGYVQSGGFASVQLLQSPGTTSPSCSPSNQPTVSVIMRIGGIITGNLRFENSPQTFESPHAAEASLPIAPITDALFGGNIVVQAYDQSGILRGVTVINGTLPNGKTGYASCSFNDTCTTLPFYVVGFTEYYNHSLSGIWQEHDYGLADGAYTLHVYIRGYELTSTSPSTIGIMNGNNQTVTVDMTRGGAFEVLVGSFDNRFGTRAIQARLSWRFLNSSIPVRARVYFYASNGVTVGYVEAIMETEVPNEIGVISFTDTDFKVIFAGQNWSLREIWYYGFVPTHITNDTYTIRAYTLGYVRQLPNGISLSNQLVGFSQGAITLFIANELDVTVPIFANPQSLTNTTEYDHAIGQAFSGSLSGAEMANLTAGIPTLQFNIFGFGAMKLSNATECTTDVLLVGSLNLCGQGHFFYVAPGGTQFFDYGLDVGNYTAALPEFGFLVHFLQVLQLPAANFADLLLQIGVSLQAIQMASITHGPILGWTDPPLDVARLSWAQVQASNSTYSLAAPSLDGLYDGVDALFLPAGTYTVTFSDVQYQSQTVPNFSVGWGSSYSLTPPNPLCPTGNTCP